MRTVFIVMFLATVTAASVSFSPAPQNADDVKVWVDTAYSFYHCPATRWYGKTKQGVYMTQKQARDRGYRPVYGIACKPSPATKAPPRATKMRKS
jgi:nuclease S1